MQTDKKKKVLILAGMEYKRESLLKKVTHLHPENIFVLQRFDPFICHPFDETMRDILIAVYQEGVDEIMVAVPAGNQKDQSRVLDKMLNNKELQNKLQTLDYLFENCMPDFPEGNVRKWLEGGKTAINCVRQCTDLIRKHPLLPSHIKVTEFLLDKKDKKQPEFGMI